MPTDDTNRRVAEACGIECRDSPRGLRVFREEYAAWLDFDPKWIAGDAVLAAEKFGLFRIDKHWCGLQQLGTGEWDVWQDCSMTGSIASGTFCSAICDAIIAIASTTPQDS
jgi:hypothetical protein